MNRHNKVKLGSKKPARTITAREFEKLFDKAKDDIDRYIDWSKAKVHIPSSKKPVALRLDADVLDWFRSFGKGYQTRINAVLRSYKSATEKISGK